MDTAVPQAGVTCIARPIKAHVHRARARSKVPRILVGTHGRVEAVICQHIPNRMASVGGGTDTWKIAQIGLLPCYPGPEMDMFPFASRGRHVSEKEPPL